MPRGAVVEDHTMFGEPDTIQGIEDRRSMGQSDVYAIKENNLPQNFPTVLWNDQQRRYMEYWRWFRGTILNETIGKTREGAPIYRYPLKINALRDFARKHCALLFGEAPDDYVPLVRCRVNPKPPTKVEQKSDSDDDKKSADSTKMLARTMENIVNEVWMQSSGRSLMQEAGTLSQFLGGCVFKIAYQYWREDEAEIPIFIEQIPADFFLPIFKANDHWNLLEAYVVYRISSAVAEREFGIKSNNSFVTYVEHWTRDHYSIWVDNVPLTMKLGDESITFDHLENPFNLVPYVYIPHLREGSFYGSSMLEDIKGLMTEYNARTADFGDAIRNSVRRKRYSRNLGLNVGYRQIAEGVGAVDLGRAPPGAKDQPDVFTEDPPVISEGLAGHTETVWTKMMRAANSGDVMYGEDDTGQRSALTLAIKMFPATSHARSERNHWTDGLQQIAYIILRMVQIKYPKYKVPKDFKRLFIISQDWHPMVPRDREQQVNELILRLQSGSIDVEQALEQFGDIRDIPGTMLKIQEWMKFRASLEAAGKPGQAAGPGEGAKSELSVPTVKPGDIKETE